MYVDHYSEYIDKDVRLVFNNRKEDDARGRVLSADPVGVRLEIRGRTKLYRNFYPWSMIGYMEYVAGRLDGDNGKDETGSEESTEGPGRTIRFD